MAAETPPPRIAARIAGLAAVVVLILGGGYFLFADRLAPPSAPAVPPAGIADAQSPAAGAESAPAGTSASDARQAANPAAAAPSPAGDAPAAAAPGDTAAAPADRGEAPGSSSAPSFDVVRVEPSGDTVAAGTAEPNATVEVLDGSTPVGQAKANERGEWAIVVDKPLDPGTHDLSIRTTSADRKTEMLSEQRVAVEVPEAPKEAPLVVLNSPDTPSRVLQQPAASATQVAAVQPATATPASADNSPGVTVDAVEFEAGKIYIAGSAAMGGTVRVYVDGVAIGDAVADAKGRWMIEANRTIGPGRHVVRADQIDKATGNVLVRAEVPFDHDGLVVAMLSPETEGGSAGGAASAGDVPAPHSVIIRRGDNLWTISRRLYGKGMRFSTIYEANTDQIRNPHLIYPGQVFVLPAGDTRWTN